MDEHIKQGAKVIGSDGKCVGYMTGATRHCTLEGCGGTRYYVKWNHGRATYPCIKGMVWRKKKKHWQIL